MRRTLVSGLRDNVWRTLAVALVVVVVVAWIARLPNAFRSFDDRAAVNDEQSALGRAIAGADAEEIDNTFLTQALALVPRNASYAIVRPQSLQVASTYGISAPTYNALYPFVLNALLPRRQVDPSRARYILCYACDTDPYDPHMKRLWQNGKGLVIGELKQ
jgi:hypothetical protein